MQRVRRVAFSSTSFPLSSHLAPFFFLQKKKKGSGSRWRDEIQARLLPLRPAVWFLLFFLLNGPLLVLFRHHRAKQRENRGDEVCIVNGSFVVDVIGDDESPSCSTAFDLPKDLAGSPGEAPARQVRSRRRLPSVEMFGPRRPVLQRGFLVFFFF